MSKSKNLCRNCFICISKLTMNVIISSCNTRLSLTIHPPKIEIMVLSVSIRWNTDSALVTMSRSIIRINSVVSGTDVILWIRCMLITWKNARLQTTVGTNQAALILSYGLILVLGGLSASKEVATTNMAKDLLVIYRHWRLPSQSLVFRTGVPGSLWLTTTVFEMSHYCHLIFLFAYHMDSDISTKTCEISMAGRDVRNYQGFLFRIRGFQNGGGVKFVNFLQNFDGQPISKLLLKYYPKMILQK